MNLEIVYHNDENRYVLREIGGDWVREMPPDLSKVEPSVHTREDFDRWTDPFATGDEAVSLKRGSVLYEVVRKNYDFLMGEALGECDDEVYRHLDKMDAFDEFCNACELLRGDGACEADEFSIGRNKCTDERRARCFTLWLSRHA